MIVIILLLITCLYQDSYTLSCIRLYRQVKIIVSFVRIRPMIRTFTKEINSDTQLQPASVSDYRNPVASNVGHKV